MRCAVCTNAGITCSPRWLLVSGMHAVVLLLYEMAAIVVEGGSRGRGIVAARIKWRHPDWFGKVVRWRKNYTLQIKQIKQQNAPRWLGKGGNQPASPAAALLGLCGCLLSDMCSGCLLSPTVCLCRRRPVGPLESQIAISTLLPLELVPANTMPVVAVGATRGEGAGQQHPTIYSAAQLCLSLNPSSVCVTHTASRVMAIR